MTQAAYQFKIQNRLLTEHAMNGSFEDLFGPTEFEVNGIVTRMYSQSNLTIVWLNRVTRRDRAAMTKADWKVVNDLVNRWTNAQEWFADTRIATSSYVIRTFGAVRETFRDGFHGAKDRWVDVYGKPIIGPAGACNGCGNTHNECECADRNYAETCGQSIR